MELPVRVAPAVVEPARSALGAVALRTARFRVLPDYLIIGTQRGGTTSLYKYLKQHPGIGRAVLGKEVQFFDRNYSGDLNTYRANFPTRAYKRYVRVRHRLDLITGEASPFYLAHPHAPYRIAEALPEAKLIALLRDPVERAYSQYNHEVALGFEHVPFEEAIEREPERIAGEVEKMRADPSYESFSYRHHTYLARGRYAEQLEVWFSLFPRSQILILRSEDLFANPDRTHRTVLEFLGLPRASLVKYETYNEHARRFGQMKAATRRRLIDYFTEPNERLYELLGVDFGWSR
jgi:hypothetical protein